MHEELTALLKNQLGLLQPCPKGIKPISCKWVYRVKKNPDGSVNKFKARLIAHGFLQTFGMNYHDSFAPVAKVVIVRLLNAYAVNNRWNVHQLDINNAFIHGKFEEDVYLTPPQSLEVPSRQVRKLKNALYGLKQAPRQWYKEFSEKIILFGFRQSTHDHCLFSMNKDGIILTLIVYVDDILITGSSDAEILKVKQFLYLEFTIKDLKKADYFLGIQICHTKDGLAIS